MEEKLIELETKFSFQEDLLQQLNEIVVQQQKKIDMQAQQLGLLLGQINEIRAGMDSPHSSPDAESPPHY